MLTLVALIACSPEELHVLDAGDPSLFEDYEGSDDAFSRLLDDGYDAVPGRYLVLVDAGVEDVSRVERELFERVPGLAIERRYDNVPAFVARLTHEEARELARHSRVRAVEPDWIATANGKPTSSGCASSSSQTTPSGITALGANSSTGAGVSVAVIDSGIDNTHSDLAVAGLVDFTGGRSGGVDDNGHGTHVAGTIAALNDSKGVVGVAPGVTLYGVKVLDRRGSGSYSAIAAGIDWAVSNGIDVANMSLGGGSNSSVLHSAVTNAFNAGVVQVVAAGNSGVSATYEYPAAYEGEVLTVSAFDVSTSSFPSWSNYGTPPVDVAAPGVGICSTYKGGGYTPLDGTSMASPHVAGAAAIYIANHPAASAPEVFSAIAGSTTTLTDTSRHTEDLSSIVGL